MQTLKWTGTGLCLVGILLTSFNIYPLNIIVGFIGSSIWAMAGYAQDDNPLLVVELVAALFYLAGIVLFIYNAIRVWL